MFYTRLLSTRDEKSSGLPWILSLFNTEAKTGILEEDWERKWFGLVARLFQMTSFPDPHGSSVEDFPPGSMQYLFAAQS